MSSSGQSPTNWRLVFKRSAYAEFLALDGAVRRKVASQLLKIRENPLVGEPLGHKMGINLTGYRKIYVDRKRIRIVWEVRDREIVVVVLGIGPRDKGKIYRLVARRVREPETE